MAWLRPTNVNFLKSFPLQDPFSLPPLIVQHANAIVQFDDTGSIPCLYSRIWASEFWLA